MGGLPQHHAYYMVGKNGKPRQNNQVVEEGGESECQCVDCTTEVRAWLLLL